MSKTLEKEFARRRREKGWTLPETARRLGCENRNKGCRRIIEFERGESELDEATRERLAALLGIDAEVMERIRLREEDALKRAFEAWRARPAKNQFYYRAIPCLYLRQDIPDHLQTDEDVITFARCFSRERGVIAWLYLGRRERLAMRNGEVTWRRPFTWRNFREPDFGVQIR
ncbi:MAG TPA: XRE family transcriptional regulator [Candidatus Aminicenantes bacterium]|nr:XRE family transcriptional regulator [Candidatus Aminicenantes bacterium]